MPRFNGNFKYFLNVTDCFSKYVWDIPLKQRLEKKLHVHLKVYRRRVAENQKTYKLFKEKDSSMSISRNKCKNMELTSIILICVLYEL